jgi:hypothetical protein
MFLIQKTDFRNQEGFIYLFEETWRCTASSCIQLEYRQRLGLVYTSIWITASSKKSGPIRDQATGDLLKILGRMAWITSKI